MPIQPRRARVEPWSECERRWKVREGGGEGGDCVRLWLQERSDLKKSQKTLNLDESSYRILERFPNQLPGESDHVAYKYSKVSSGTQSFRNPIEPLKWFPRGGVTKSMSFCVFVYLCIIKTGLPGFPRAMWPDRCQLFVLGRGMRRPACKPSERKWQWLTPDLLLVWLFLYRRCINFRLFKL